MTKSMHAQKPMPLLPKALRAAQQAFVVLSPILIAGRKYGGTLKL